MAVDLNQKLVELARTRVLLVGSDYDGTLAPIADNPENACAIPSALSVLTKLTALPRTYVAVISGRTLADLRLRFKSSENIELVGSHGAEREGAFGDSLDTDRLKIYAELVRVVNDAASLASGSRVELKPFSVTFHYRQATDDDALLALDSLIVRTAKIPQISPRQGKKALEFSLVDVTKGDAFWTLRTKHDASAAIFVGDDLTDEDVFVRMGKDDLAVKVGPEESAASYRVLDPIAVAEMLERLLQLRAEAVKAMD